MEYLIEIRSGYKLSAKTFRDQKFTSPAGVNYIDFIVVVFFFSVHFMKKK